MNYYVRLLYFICNNKYKFYQLENDKSIKKVKYYCIVYLNIIPNTILPITSLIKYIYLVFDNKKDT